MPGDSWNPAQYERFRDERSRPFYDLLVLVQPAPAMRVIDLGCGTGALTLELHRRLNARETIGLDRSQAMLAQSAAHAATGLRFVHGDIAAFAAAAPAAPGAPPAAGALDTFVGPGAGGAAETGSVAGAAGTFDLIFSNAALQWLPDHEALLAGLTRRLSPGGQIAVQVPANEDYPSHVVAREVAGESPFRGALGGHITRFGTLTPEGYAALLDRLGYRSQHVRLQVYAHHLPSRAAVVDWVRGTLLTDYQQRLPPGLFDQFLERYRERLLPRLDDTHPFFYPFKRILFWGRRP